jgi:glycosyltransferase involved in cell wall biosynthesis
MQAYVRACAIRGLRGVRHADRDTRRHLARTDDWTVELADLTQEQCSKTDRNLAELTTRCDLHLHSAASLTTRQWFSEYFDAPESYADPLRQYELCRARGMDLVTLTDHDSIEGGLLLVDRPDFFLSVEVSTRFPENDCAVHVLVYNITPAQHRKLQRLRDSVFGVVDFIRSEGLAYALPHPLLSPNWRMDRETLEKCFVLFPTVETINGLNDRRVSPFAQSLIASLTPEVLGALSAKHGIPLAYGKPRRPAQTAGSDDHGHRRAGTIFTEVRGKLGAAKFLDRVMDGDGRLVGEAGDLNAMAMCIKQGAYEHFRRKGAGISGQRNPFVDVMDVLAGRVPATDANSPRGANALVENFVRAAQRARLPVGVDLDITLTPDEGTDESDRRIVEAVTKISDTLAADATDELVAAATAFDVYGLFAALTDLGSAMVIASPLLFAADHFARQWDQAQRIRKEWRATTLSGASDHLAVFSDSRDNIDGVATWCRRFMYQAETAGRRVWFASCDEVAPVDSSCPTASPIASVARFKVPLYPGFEVKVPSLPGTVDRLWREGITHLELATPGPMGLAGLAAARLLRLPVTASFHTDLYGLAVALTGQSTIADLARAYLHWFYCSVDRVFAFSAASREKLLEMGVPSTKIEVMPIAVDPDDFAPRNASASTLPGLGLNAGNRPVVLSVGRLSPEKNLDVIIDAVERLQHRNPAPLLVVAGDGPARDAIERGCRGKSFVAFVGVQEGTVLRQLYASAHAFVFASTVDTLGLVNLEALASGVPVLVPSNSAIAGLLDDGDNALFFDPDADALSDALSNLLDDPARAARVAAGGRSYTLDRWQTIQFDEVWHTMVDGSATARAA